MYKLMYRNDAPNFHEMMYRNDAPQEMTHQMSPMEIALGVLIHRA